MYSDDVFILLLALVTPLFFAFVMGKGCKRSENSVKEFYYILREKYPRSYVKPNKIIKFVRKLLKMEIKGKIHWMICFLHYFQIVWAISPMIMLIVFIFTQSEQVIYTFLAFGVPIPYGLSETIYVMFNIFQEARCKKIKKTIPRYSNSVIYHWYRSHI